MSHARTARAARASKKVGRLVGRGGRHAVTRTALLGLLAACSIATVGGLGPQVGGLGPGTATATGLTDERPNLILITTDDQNADELRYMPATRRLLGAKGVTATNFINPHPVCCPARAELLTGEYAHNNGVIHNDGPHGGYPAFVKHGGVRNNIGGWMNDAGYATAFVGKMLNHYGEHSPAPRGWDVWNPTTGGTYEYYGTEFFNDGDPRVFPRQYVADVVRDYALGYIDRFAAADDPFFVWLSHVGPHAARTPTGWHDGPIPADRHEDLYRGVRTPSREKPSFWEQDLSDKPRWVRDHSAKGHRHLDELFRNRIRSLRAIDEATAAVVKRLAAVGELDNTVILFTSDNGHLLGEHRIIQKNYPYEEALRVPFVVRGPGLPAGVRTGAPINLVDIATTFLARAGALGQVRASGHTDGIDIWPVLRGERKISSTQLIQAGSDDPAALRATPKGWLFRGVRTARYTYLRWYTGEEELYDAHHDRYQLDNKADDARYRRVVLELRERTRKLTDCSGGYACRTRGLGGEPQPLPRR